MVEKYLGGSDVEGLIEMREIMCLLADRVEVRRNEDVTKYIRPAPTPKRSSLSEQRRVYHCITIK